MAAAVSAATAAATIAGMLLLGSLLLLLAMDNARTQDSPGNWNPWSRRTQHRSGLQGKTLLQAKLGALGFGTTNQVPVEFQQGHQNSFTSGHGGRGCSWNATNGLLLTTYLTSIEDPQWFISRYPKKSVDTRFLKRNPTVIM